MAAAALPTKGHTDEAFPVASRLLAPALRAPVLAFYRFVRTADDVADAPDLSPDEKLQRLDAMEHALLAADPASPVAAALARTDREHGAGIAEARLLLAAFRQDATQHRYADWGGLRAYCRLSAEPVGRFLLRLHGEPTATGPTSDALCAALQILNHLQDLAPDRDRLDRVYLPTPWLDRAGGEAAFFAPDAAARRRPILDAALDQVDALLAQARPLPGALESRGLVAQAAATLACGRALSRKLRRHDPIARRVTLGKAEIAALIGTALVRSRLGRPAPRDADLARAIVGRSGSSFRLGIRSCKGDRRRGMQALYAYCRIVDDLADSAAPAFERDRFLEGWGDELDRLTTTPTTPIGRELAWACDRFALPSAELRLLLDAMIGDAADRVRLADEPALERYCRGVAGTVGLLSVRIFGSHEADTFALKLARALQLTNILRDVTEDAARDRLYIPLTRLAAHGLDGRGAEAAIADPRFATVWAALADEAADAFTAAEASLEGLDRGPLRPALLMLWSYRPLLERLRRQGWHPDRPRVRLGRAEKLRLAWRAIQAPA